jgi:peptidoglycan hydrolase-like protein with peptidoglycan-binding domain
VLGAALVAAASAGAVALASGRTPAALTAPVETTEAPSEPIDFGDDREVDVTFVRVTPQPLLVSRDGTVTESTCVPGVPAVSGTPLLRVDEAVVYGLHTDIPLFRSLQLGDNGRDVSALQAELLRLGRSVSVDGQFGPGTRNAVRELEKAVGIAAPDGVLDRAEVIWLPTPTAMPASCDLLAGQRASTGGPYAALAASLVAARLGALPPGALPGPRTVTIFGHPLAVDPAQAIVDPAYLAALAASPEYLQGLEAKDADRPKARLTLSSPVRAHKVPPGAVFGIVGAKACVQSGGRAVPVTLVGSGLGASLVTTETDLGPVAVGRGITTSTCGAP